MEENILEFQGSLESPQSQVLFAFIIFFFFVIHTAECRLLFFSLLENCRKGSIENKR